MAFKSDLWTRHLYREASTVVHKIWFLFVNHMQSRYLYVAFLYREPSSIVPEK